MEDDEEDEYCKVVLLGESGVGKTSIITRFINGTFEKSLMSTNGASYVSKNLEFPEYENRIIKFEIWDTAGQEQYRALNKIFYKDASICILVYDITNMNSFNNLRDYWHQELLDSAPKNIILGLAANKSDLYEKEEVQEEIARQFANEINAIFMYTSASISVGIDQLFHYLGCKYIDKDFKVEDVKLSDIKKNLAQKKENNNNKDKDKKKIKLNNKKHKENNKKKKKSC